MRPPGSLGSVENVVAAAQPVIITIHGLEGRDHVIFPGYGRRFGTAADSFRNLVWAGHAAPLDASAGDRASFDTNGMGGHDIDRHKRAPGALGHGVHDQSTDPHQPASADDRAG